MQQPAFKTNWIELHKCLNHERFRSEILSMDSGTTYETWEMCSRQTGMQVWKGWTCYRQWRCVNNQLYIIMNRKSTTFLVQISSCSNSQSYALCISEGCRHTKFGIALCWFGWHDPLLTPASRLQNNQANKFSDSISLEAYRARRKFSINPQRGNRLP